MFEISIENILLEKDCCKLCFSEKFIIKSLSRTGFPFGVFPGALPKIFVSFNDPVLSF